MRILSRAAAGWLVLPAVLSIAACSPEERGGIDGDSWDENGVPIVESSADAPVPTWTVSAEPLVEVGGAEADFVLVAGALRTADGFVVADAGTGEIRFHDEDGHPLRVVGGKGGGPGEFQYIGWMGRLPGDSLAAWDPLLRRLTVLTGDGRHARDVRPAGVDGFFPTVHGRFDDGTLVVSDGMEATGRERRAGAWRDSMTLLRIDPTGAVRDTLGRVPGPSRYVAASADGGMATYSVPFGPSTFVTVHGSSAFVATGERYEIVALDRLGQPRRRLRHRTAARPVTSREREAYASRMLHGSGTPGDETTRRAAIASAPFPRTMAPILGLMADGAGKLWVREAQSPATWDTLSRWTVFDADGRRIASVRGPGRLAPLEIGPDWVLARKVDADGTERVGLFRLTR